MADIPVNANDALVSVDVVTNGQTAFTFDFLAYDAADIRAIYEVGGVRTPVTNFTVAGLQNANGGTLQLTAGAPVTVAGARLIIYRATVIQRIADYQTYGDFRASTVNREMDIVIMILQEIARDVLRSLKLPYNFSGDVEELALRVVNLKSAAYQEASAFATAQQGSNGDLALSLLQVLSFKAAEPFQVLNLTIGQTLVPVPGGYTSGLVSRVHLNGVELLQGQDYYAIDGVNIVLTKAIAADDFGPAGEAPFITGEKSTTVAGLAALDSRYRPGGLRYLPDRNSFLANPAYNPIFPGGTKNTIMFAPGAADPLAINLNRSILVGVLVGSRAIDWDRNEGIGDNALMFMRYGTRNTMVGSIAGQWLGTNDPVGTGHNYWAYNDGTGTAKNPGDVGWDYDGLETANPGIGQKIKDWVATNPWATQSSDVGYNVGLGRNAFNGTLVGSQNTALGYRASAGAIYLNQMVTLGCDAGRKGVFHKNGVIAGYAAGTNWQEGERNLIAGFQAGVGGVRGSRNTLLGAYAGSNYTDINDSVMIGHGAGNGLGGTAKNGVLAINVSNGAPLIAGNFLPTGGDFVGPNAGINIIPGDILGTLHVRSTKRGGGLLVLDASADDLVVESEANVGISLIAGSTANRAQLNITAPGRDGNYAALGFSFALDRMVLRSAGADRLYLLANGDAELTGTGNGLILHAANDTRYKVVVSNAGVLSAVAA